MLGKWQNLLTVFNPIDKSVAHYLNAQQVSNTKISKKVLAKSCSVMQKLVTPALKTLMAKQLIDSSWAE